MSHEKQTVYLTGIGMGNALNLTRQAEEIFRDCDCIIGARRMTEALGSIEKPTFISYNPKEISTFIKEHREYRTVAVALSGDPGFYSGAKKLREKLSDCHVVTLPGISALVYLASKLGISWEDAAFVSIHGREQSFIHAISRHEKTFLLLGGKDCGEKICQRLACYGLEDVVFIVGKRLSYENEEIIYKKGAELVPSDFDNLSAAYVLNPSADKRISPHLEDEEFIRARVPMTKAEIRAVSLAKLELTKGAVLYDVGAGTGSVGIEAACHFEGIRVYAIEKNPEALELIDKNRQKFFCDNLEIIEGTAPQALTALEPPTHAFIGGSSGNLKDILRLLLDKNPQIIIVLNAISLETLKDAMEAAQEGLLPNAQILQITAARARLLKNYHMMTGQNPVYIIKASAHIEDKESCLE